MKLQKNSQIKLEIELNLTKTKINYLRGMNNWMTKLVVFALFSMFLSACTDDNEVEESTQNNQKKRTR